MRRCGAAAACLALAALLAAACTGAPHDDPATPASVDYIVSPHPDDEFQGWSLVEDSPSTYQVFIVLTHGEETGFCRPRAYAEDGLDAPFERPADPEPQGRWTPSCERARLGSWLAFMEDMSAHDPSLPGRLKDLGTKGPFPGGGAQVCRRDRDERACGEGARSVRVWQDERGRGALVAFDLGDGDLSAEEVVWAVDTVRRHREDLGLPADLPEGDLVGASFSNLEHPDCYVYEHPDHRAVHDALHEHDFGVGRQLGATCRSDPAADLLETVSRAGVEAAFAREGRTRVGAHNANYGWLHTESYPVDRHGQDTLFHAEQAFWTRF